MTCANFNFDILQEKIKRDKQKSKGTEGRVILDQVSSTFQFKLCAFVVYSQQENNYHEKINALLLTPTELVNEI